MGMYINYMPDGTPLPPTGKARMLKSIEGAKVVTINASPPAFEENLVCIVDNGLFEAAGYAFDREEFEAFCYDDGRPRIWLSIPNAKDIAK